MKRADSSLAVCRAFSATDGALTVCKLLDQEGISFQPYNAIPASIGALEVYALCKATSAQHLLGSQSFA